MFQLLLIAAVFAIPCFTIAETLVIRSAVIVDGTGAAKTKPLDVLIENDKIAKIGMNLQAPASARTIEAQGMILTPGLIDTHTHLRTIPGAKFRVVPPDMLQRTRDHQLRSYVAAGVTTVLDCAASEALLLEAKSAPQDRHAPRIMGLAPFITPERGYFAGMEDRDEAYRDLWPPMSNTDEFGPVFDRAKQLNALGAKVTLEKGMGPFDIWPIFDDSARNRVAAEAAKRGVPLFIHSMTESEHRAALTMKPYALVHSGFHEAEANDGIVREIANSGAFVSTTSAIQPMMLLMWNRELLNQEWVKRLVPKEQLATAVDERIRELVIEQVVLMNKPFWIPALLARPLAGLFFNVVVVQKEMAHVLKSLKMMYDAGVPLVMGSDSGNWPTWTTFFHGVGTVLEMETLKQAGIPQKDILVMATSRAAKMLKIDSFVGTVAEGMTADLVLLKKDPTVDHQAFRDVVYVVKGGVAKTPDEWMKPSY